MADPLGGACEPDLRRAFPDHVVPFKRHQVRDLDQPVELPVHHRRHIRRASDAVQAEVCAEPLEYLDDWIRALSGAGRAPRADGHQGVLPGVLPASARVAGDDRRPRRAGRRDGRDGALAGGRAERLLPPRRLLPAGVRGEHFVRAVRRSPSSICASSACACVNLGGGVGGAPTTAWCASSAAGPPRSGSPICAAGSSTAPPTSGWPGPRTFEWFPAYRAPDARMSDFAILGGAPAFAEPMHVGRPNIGDRDRLMERIGGRHRPALADQRRPARARVRGGGGRVPRRAALHRHVQRHGRAGDRDSRSRAATAR